MRSFAAVMRSALSWGRHRQLLDRVAPSELTSRGIKDADCAPIRSSVVG